ncbi:chloramphenicol phosphotransferase CPT family protein [Tumebacillus flagellatus]|uniref:Chloramphenicol phosphotransferase n=1 Tax=Tumebacillus flagellatus TaxID=1157490 RepID=A0A074MBC7_9BACL|nr:AAA family ATPase [Tumebacillus flagellatus]KEO83242.1 hypothetical protein EL26_11160 [Tumebacillus flagellatus]
MARGTILLLNGTSSAGKSSLAKHLQNLNEEPYYHMQADQFWDMAPERACDQDIPLDERRPLILALHENFHQCVAAVSDMGRPVIVDHVFEGKSWLVDAVHRLADYPVVFVGVHCPVEELERRERERGDRIIGLAKYQMDIVHQHAVYDLEVNTHTETIAECAAKIMEFVHSGREGVGVKKTLQALQQTLQA